jgi:lipopolysaccharide transport system permease protein
MRDPDAAIRPWVENRPSEGFFPGLNVGELWAFRELAYVLAIRDIKIRYKQALFGFGWAVLQPLIAVAIFSFVFGHVTHVPTQGIPYPVFVYSGLAVWFFFSAGVNAAAQSLVGNAALVTKTYFPRILAPLASILPASIDLAISLAIVTVFMVGYSVEPTAALALLPVWIVGLFVLTLGFGVWVSALNVRYRDVRYVLGFLVQTLLYASPVVFPSVLIEGAWRYAYALNPVVGVIDGFRWSLVGGSSPHASDIVSFAVMLVVLVSGLVYFRRVERRFADVI